MVRTLSIQIPSSFCLAKRHHSNSHSYRIRASIHLPLRIYRSSYLPWNYRECGITSLDDPSDEVTQHATSKDAKVQPEIDPNYIEDEFDLELLLDGMKFIRKLAATEAWKEISEEEFMPGKDVKTDEELRGQYHATSLC